MLSLLLATTLALAVDPFDLVRVDDPDHPDAVARSATGAVLLEPPEAGTPWRSEAVPEVDGWVGAEAIEAMNVAPWHEAGLTGRGVKVAVFDLQWVGTEAHLDAVGGASTHDCWFHPTCAVPMDTWRPRFGFEEGVHGIACAEVIHGIAPDAQLHLVRVNGQTTLENAVDWAIREGIDIVSMSLSFFNTSFYDGTGPISRQAAKLREAGVLMVTSAGNYARGHWRGRYVDGDLDGRMDFDGENGLWIWLQGGSSQTLHVAWNQFRTCGATDLDARIVDPAGHIIARSEAAQLRGADRCEPMERVRVRAEDDGWYRLEVLHRRGPVSALDVSVIAPGGRIHGSMPEGSIADPGVSADVLTVGAVRADGYLRNDVESFSSWGPTIHGLAKPDIAGPNGLSTATYGPVGFYGTSASAPAVAGAIALLLSEDPGLTPFEAARRLQGYALTDTPGLQAPDPRWGAGKARLPVPGEEPQACGRRPLLLPLFLVPLGWLRRRQRG